MFTHRLTARLKAHGSVRRMQAAGDAANGLGSTLVSEVPVGAALTSAALFIDLSSAQVRLHGMPALWAPAFWMRDTSINDGAAWLAVNAGPCAVHSGVLAWRCACQLSGVEHRIWGRLRSQLS